MFGLLKRKRRSEKVNEARRERDRLDETLEARREALSKLVDSMLPRPTEAKNGRPE